MRASNCLCSKSTCSARRLFSRSAAVSSAPGVELPHQVVGPLDISLKDELLFIKSLLIPAFDPDNELETSKKRKKWLETRGVEKKWSLEILTELIERYGTIVSLEEAEDELEKVQAERLLKKAEENERKHGKNHLFTLIVLRLFLSIIF